MIRTMRETPWGVTVILLRNSARAKRDGDVLTRDQIEWMIAGASDGSVPDYQLSLAIGREGQNARLAARLTGWRIDIRSDTAPA